MALFGKPSIKKLRDKKRDIPHGLWIKCPSCVESIHKLELRKNLNICNKCDHHFSMTAYERISSLVYDDFLDDDDNLRLDGFDEKFSDIRSKDNLNFLDYGKKIDKYINLTGINEAVVTGEINIGSHLCGVAVMDFRFLGASMGAVVGEKITLMIEEATKKSLPVLVFSASGGARMHEGIISLMQMAKTSGALALHAKARLPYISILTHPTTGGVTASFATLGDLIIAEPKCMIGFAGPRVIKEITHEDLPEGFQTAEFMLEHGLVDKIVHRRDMRGALIKILGFLAG